MKHNPSELWAVLVLSVLNLVFWFSLLSAVPAAIVGSITGLVLGVAVSEYFNRLDRKRATISDTSDI